MVLSVWGHKRPSCPQETWEASHGPWPRAPRKCAQLSLLSKQPPGGGGIQSAWGFPVWKCRENNAPGCVRGGGLPLVSSPGEHFHVDREFQRVLWSRAGGLRQEGQISLLLMSFKFLFCKTKG